MTKWHSETEGSMRVSFKRKTPELPRVRGLIVVLVLLGSLVCTVGSRSASAMNAGRSFLAQTFPGLQEADDLKPVLIARKRRGIRGQRNWRKRSRRKGQHGKHRSREDKAKSDHKKPNRKKARRDKPGKHNTKDGKPDRGPNNLVCIGGKVKAGKCRCRRARAQRLGSQAVYGCAVAGNQIILPGTLVLSPKPPGRTVSSGNSTEPSRAAEPRSNFVPDEVLITVDRLVNEAVDDAIAQTYGVEVTGRWSLASLDTRLVRYRIGDARTVAQIIAAMQGDPRIGAPQPNYYYRPQASSAKPHVAELQYALAKVDIDSAHAVAHGRGARIAILDSGIDASHPDLAGAVVESFDVAGGKAAQPGSHGTAIAGIIRARGLIRGIAPEAALLSVSVFEATGADGSPATTTAKLLRGIDWALSRRVHVINMSLAGPHDPLLERGITRAHGEQVIVVAAAGNDGSKAPPAYPAAYSQVIAVTATDVADRLYTSANHGGYITVAAPGVDVLAPALEHGHLLHTGTSFAAAHVSGIIALMVEHADSVSTESVRRALMEAAGDLGPPGRDDLFGAGRTDAFMSLVLIAKSEQAQKRP